MSNTKARQRAGIYLRISKDTDRTGAAIDRQREDCQLICKINDYEVIEEYVDQSISAYSGKERPAYDRMIQDFKNRKLDIIVAWKLDRLSRDQLGFMKVLVELQEDKLVIHTTDVGRLDLKDPFSVNMATNIVGMAQFESQRKSERMIRANEQRAQQGRRKRGYHTYGYNLDYNVIPENANVVINAYNAIAQGYPLNAVVRALNGEGDVAGVTKAPKPNYVRMALINQQRAERKQPLKPMPEYGPWERTALVHILRNPFYCGLTCRMPWSEWKKKNSNPRKHMKDFIVTDDNGNYVKATDHEAIIDTATWWKVQSILDNPERSKNGTGSNRRYLGTSVYRCAICGKPVTCSRHSYECKGHMSRRGQKIDEFVRRLVEERLKDPDLIKEFKASASPAVTDVMGQIEELQTRIGNATAIAIGINSKVARKRAEAEIERMQRELDKLEEKQREASQLNAVDAIASADAPVEAFRQLNVTEQAKIVKMLMIVKLDKRPRGAHMMRVPQGVHVEWLI